MLTNRFPPSRVGRPAREIAQPTSVLCRSTGGVHWQVGVVARIGVREAVGQHTVGVMPPEPARGLYVLISSLLIHSSAGAAEALPPQLYEVITETAMPHLEENLRYATTREQHCLKQNELWSAFPMLNYAALKDCRLDHEGRQEDEVSYSLVCKGGHGTTGHATWWHGRERSIGTLSVKLGGKNMTFYQRVTARVLGACSQTR